MIYYRSRWGFFQQVCHCFVVPLVPGLVQLSGEKEDGLLSDVGSWTEFSFAVFLQGYVPSVVLILPGLICVVVVLLQILQEVTFIGYCGLQQEHKQKVHLDIRFKEGSMVCELLYIICTHWAVQTAFIAHGQVSLGFCPLNDDDASVHSFDP